MKVIEKSGKDGKIELRAIASSSEVSRALTEAQIEFAQQMGLQVSNERPVAQVAQEELGIRDLDSVVQTTAIELLVPYALDKRNIVPAFPPKPKAETQLKRGQSFTFTLEVTPKPEYELSSYDPVTITIPPLVIEDEMIDEEVHNIAVNFTRYEEAEPHTIGEDDCFKMALEASQNGEPLDKLSTKGRTYVMGMQLMPQDFEKELVGMNVGDSKDVSFKMPGTENDEHPDIIDCKVTILGMEKRVIPEVTDEWIAKELPGYKDVKTMRSMIEQQLLSQASDQYEYLKLDAAATELAKRFEGEISDEVYEAAAKSINENLRAGIEAQGTSWEDFINQQGGEQNYQMLLMMQTRQNLVQGYSLDAVYRHEGLKINDDDLNEAAARISPKNPRGIRKQMEDEGQGYTLRELAERVKANKWVLEHATINYQEQAPAEYEAGDGSEGEGEN